jgi:hypothetical protein
MKTVIFWHFNVIEIIFTLNSAPERKDNARTASSSFNGHWYGQGPNNKDIAITILRSTHKGYKTDHGMIGILDIHLSIT